MSTTEANSLHEVHKETPYMIFVLLVSIYALLLLAVESTVELDPETLALLNWADTAVCALFFVDFLYLLWRADRKLQYLVTWGWLDLVSSIPVLVAMRWARTARIVRILRILRGVRSIRILARMVLERRAESALLAASLVTLLLVSFSAVSVLYVERQMGDQAKIHTPEDALWWAIVTITTVGYGDKYPITIEGRCIAAVLMIAGVGLFGTVSGLIAAWFLSPHGKNNGDEIAALRKEVRELSELLRERKRVA
jgi:voltage-gated potassium channel